MSIRDAAKGLIHGGKVDQGTLNMVEMAFRAYDRMLRMRKHISQSAPMPMTIKVFDSHKILLKTLQRPRELFSVRSYSSVSVVGGFTLERLILKIQ